MSFLELKWAVHNDCLDINCDNHVQCQCPKDCQNECPEGIPNMDKNIDNVKAALSNNDVNLQNTQTGWTALLHACSLGKYEIVKLLVENGADVNLKTFADCSPLYIAAIKNNMACALYLFEQGADLDIYAKVNK